MKKGTGKFGATICSAIFAMMVCSGVITVKAVAQPNTAPSTVTMSTVKPLVYDRFYEGQYFAESKVVAVTASYLDLNGDNKFSVADTVLLARFVAEDSTASIPRKPDLNNNDNVSQDEVIIMLKLLKGIETDIVLVSDVTTPITTTTALTTTETTTTITNPKVTTNTTKVTTSKTTSKVTTTKLTTVTKPTTTKVTTTTAKTTTTKTTTTTIKTTTTTAKPTTTTIKTTTTTTMITTTTTTRPALEEAFPFLDEILDEVTVDTVVPPYTEDDGNTEDKDNVYLFKVGNTTYAYTVLSRTSEVGGELLCNANVVNGLHIWVYDGSNKTYSINDAVPDTTGKSFVANEEYSYLYKGKQYNYQLKSYNKIDYSDIWYLAEIACGARLQSADNTLQYDYNLNGIIDKEDLAIIIQHVTADPKFWFPWLNEEAMEKYFSMIPENHTNVVVLRTDVAKAVEYAYCIPTSDIQNPDFACTIDGVVQVLPKSMEEIVSAKYANDEFANDDSYDFIVWEPEYKMWAQGAHGKDSYNWKFASGLYIYLLNEDGSYRLEWVE